MIDLMRCREGKLLQQTDFFMFLKDIQIKKSRKWVAKNPLILVYEIIPRKWIAKNPLVLVYEVNGRKWIAKNPLNLFYEVS